MCLGASDCGRHQFMEIVERCREMSGDFCNLLKDQREKEAKAVLRGAGGDLGTVSSWIQFQMLTQMNVTGGRWRESHWTASTFESSK